MRHHQRRELVARDDLLAQADRPDRRSSDRARPCARRAAAAAACSQVAISSVSAWRWPPESVPMALSSRSSRPMPSRRTRSRISCAEAGVQAPSPGRASARAGRPARGSRQSTCSGAVPLNGILEHAADQRRAPVLRPARDVAAVKDDACRRRPGRCRRRHSASVDLPEPLVPMTMTNDPSLDRQTSRSCSARTSLGVPGVERLRDVADFKHSAARARFRPQLRPADRAGPAPTNTKAAVISFRSFGFSPTQGDRHQQPEQHRAHHRADDREPELLEPTSASPMMTLASPHTTMPMPICTSAKP